MLYDLPRFTVVHEQWHMRWGWDRTVVHGRGPSHISIEKVSRQILDRIQCLGPVVDMDNGIIQKLADHRAEVSKEVISRRSASAVPWQRLLRRATNHQHPTGDHFYFEINPSDKIDDLIRKAVGRQFSSFAAPFVSPNSEVGPFHHVIVSLLIEGIPFRILPELAAYARPTSFRRLLRRSVRANSAPGTTSESL